MNKLLDDGRLLPVTDFHKEPASKTRGTDLMLGMLLNQYQNSPLLIEYYSAFIAELDLLFEQIEKVHLERFITYAVGAQQDVIGRILKQSRAIELPTLWFGMAGAIDVAGMADEATPTMGGVFKDENIAGLEVTPLDDITYRRLLMARAVIGNRNTIDIQLAYHVVCILMGRVPKVFEIRDSDSHPSENPDTTLPMAKRAVELLLDTNSTTLAEIQLILYTTKYFVPATISFTIRLV